VIVSVSVDILHCILMLWCDLSRCRLVRCTGHIWRRIT